MSDNGVDFLGVAVDWPAMDAATIHTFEAGG